MYENVTHLANTPGVQWFGIIILEPFSVLTNLMIAAACFYAFRNLQRKKLNGTTTQRFITYFFLCMGFATVIGGLLGHGFIYVTGLYGRIPGWYISMAGVAFFERAAIAHGRPYVNKMMGQFFSVLNYVEILTFMTLTFINLNFIFVLIHTFYGLFIVVFCTECYVYLKTRDPSFKYVISATSFGLLAAICHLFKLGINKWFNYNDVSHLAMIGTILCYYQAALRIQVHKKEVRNETLPG